MAFFKFRKTADDCASAPPATQSIETLRQRAKYRLLGASVLVLIGVIGFPLLFDKQPRPIAVDTPIDIPDRNKVATLQLATVGAPAAPVASAASVPLEAASVATAVAAAPVASTAELIAVPASQPAASAETAEAARASKDSSAKLSPLPANKASLASNGGPSEAANSAALAASAASIKSTDATARVAEAARAQALCQHGACTRVEVHRRGVVAPAIPSAHALLLLLLNCYRF